MLRQADRANTSGDDTLADDMRIASTSAFLLDRRSATAKIATRSGDFVDRTRLEIRRRVEIRTLVDRISVDAVRRRVRRR